MAKMNVTLTAHDLHRLRSTARPARLGWPSLLAVAGVVLLVIVAARGYQLATTAPSPRVEVAASVAPITVYQGRNAWTVYVHPPITARPPLWFEPLPSQREAYNARCAACHSLGR